MSDEERDTDGGGEAAAEHRPLPPTERLRLQPPFAASADGRYHVSQLLSFHDRPFVEAAFAATLAREADPAEVTQTLADLRAGRRTKIEIIESLIGSPEGRGARAAERIEGVRGGGGLSQRLRELPVVGGVWRVLVLVARLPQLARHQQEFETYTTAQLQLVTDHVNAQIQLAAARTQIVADHLSAQRGLVGDFVNRRVDEVVAHVNSVHRDTVGHVNDGRQLSADYVNEQRQRIHDYINDELRPALADATDSVSMLSDALAAMRARVEEQQLRLDAQEEFLVQEKHEIVEAQKTALAEIEGRLHALLSERRESLDEQRRALEELSARVDDVRASVAGARSAAGEDARSAAGEDTRAAAGEEV